MSFNKVIPEMLPIASQTEVNAGTSDIVLVTPKTFLARLTQAIANMLTTANFASVTDTTSSDKVETPAGSQKKVDTLATAVNTKIDSLSDFKKGMIVMWSGSTAAIPDGWLLCDGLNGTPSLLDRFIIGAGSGFGVGNSGGANTHTHTATSSVSISGSVAGTVLTLAQIPNHTHTLPISSSGEYGGNTFVKGQSTGAGTITTSISGGGGSHAHGFTGSGSASVNVTSAGNLPPYYALAFIMKS